MFTVNQFEKKTKTDSMYRPIISIYQVKQLIKKLLEEGRNIGTAARGEKLFEIGPCASPDNLGKAQILVLYRPRLGSQTSKRRRKGVGAHSCVHLH